MGMSEDKYSRRQVLLLAAGGLATVAGVTGYRRWTGLAGVTHGRGGADDSPIDQAMLNTLVDFLGAFFGIALSSLDRTELQQRLALSMRIDSNWRVDYPQLVDFADNTAQHYQHASFSAANEVQRQKIVATMLERDSTRRQQRIQAFFSINGKARLRLQRATVPQLAKLYRSSGVPWRRRGYTSWPGVGGDTFAYSSAPAKTGC